MFRVETKPGFIESFDSARAAELRRHVTEQGVLCLSLDRKLTDEEFEAVASMFGPIKDPVGRTKQGDTFQYSRTRQVIDAGYVLTEEERKKHGDLNFGGLDDARPGLFETWHCDDTYTEDPALLTILHARALPPSGGGPTHFMDMRAAYATLPAETRHRIDGLQVQYAYNNQDAFPPRRGATGKGECLVDTTHPLVRTHPEAGTRALFMDLDRACGIADLPTTEGRALLQSLQDHAETSAPRCQHDWHEYDVLIWDNASVQHKAGGNFKLGEPRRFWRYMIAGPKPA